VVDEAGDVERKAVSTGELDVPDGFALPCGVHHDVATTARTGGSQMSEVVEHHRRACDGFTQVVGATSGRWDAPSPCSEWDARGVVEHVIGFHDVLLLRPLDAKPTRPKDDPIARWSVTVEALFFALASPAVLDAQRASLLGVLTTDVLVHTWDLSKATGREVSLDPELCEIGFERVETNREKFAALDMFGPPVAVADDGSIQDKLLGLFGRDPAWTLASS
jgi:uncharacterized protein (TIGR03086 family)